MTKKSGGLPVESNWGVNLVNQIPKVASSQPSISWFSELPHILIWIYTKKSDCFATVQFLLTDKLAVECASAPKPLPNEKVMSNKNSFENNRSLFKANWIKCFAGITKQKATKCTNTHTHTAHKQCIRPVKWERELEPILRFADDKVVGSYLLFASTL